MILFVVSFFCCVPSSHLKKNENSLELFFDLVTNLSDYEGDLSYMDDEDIDEITYTNSNPNRKSLTGTSITSMSEDINRRGSISTLNQQTFEEILKDEDGEFYFKDLTLS